MVRRWFRRRTHDHLSLGNAKRFSYRSLQLATNNFSDNMVIGMGGFARTYRGVLPNGAVIAVKKYIDKVLSSTDGSPQDYYRMEESKKRPRMREVTQMLEGASNIFGRQLLAPYSPHYFSAASSFRTSISQTDETQPAVSEIEEAGTSAAQSHAATVSQQLLVHQQRQLGVVFSGTGDLVERLSQTMVFTRSTQRDFPEAVFPPFRTRVFSRGGSRHLYTF